MSTFAAPASATSGLQGYAIEGAGRKRKRKKVADYIAMTRKSAPPQAAGIALMTSQGKALFMRRAGDGDHVGEWAFPGGGIEAGESAEEAAIREVREETGYQVQEDNRIIVGRIANDEVDFTTFFQRVDGEFEPTLNSEHDAYRWQSLENPPQPLHPGVRAVLPLVLSAAVDFTAKLTKSAGKQTLYVSRYLRDTEQLRDWAAANGFPSTIDDDMHVTIAYSREPVEWALIERSTEPLLRVDGGARSIQKFGKDGEAVVLQFESEELAARHREIRQAGASWDWPDFKPHVTITYKGKDIPVDGMLPFGGVLEFGPEHWAEVNDDWKAGVVEKHDAFGDNTMTDLSLFVPVLKVDATQRMVYGTAVAEVADRANEIFDYATSKPEFEKWSGEIAKASDGKSLGNVRAMHGHVAAGKLTDLGFDDEAKKIDVAAKIVDDDEWKKVEEGVYTGFSIGGKYLKRWQDGDLKRYTAAPSEISLVDLPCVPTATFELIKADGTEVRKFISVTTEGETDKTTVVEKTEVSNSGEDWDQVWVSKRLPGQTFAKKVDLQKALIGLDAEEAAAKKAAAVLGSEIEPKVAEDEAKKAAEIEAAKLAETEAAKKAAEDAEIEKREFDAAERKKDAKSGAAEGDGSYPIENKTDLENAIRAYGRSKNKAKTKRHIIARARSLGLTAMLPADWKAKKLADAADLAKDASLYGMSDLMNMLACVECLEDRAESNSYGFGVDLPKEVTDRFGLALVNLGDVVADILDAVLADIRKEERDEAVNRAAEIAGLIKTEAVTKKEETTKVADGEVEKTAASEAIAGESEELKIKLAAAESAFEKKLAAIKEDMIKREAERDARVAEQEARIAKAEARNDELQKQVMTIRSMPMTAPSGPFRVVDKTFDTSQGMEKVAPAVINDDELRRKGLSAQLARIGGPR